MEAIGGLIVMVIAGLLALFIDRDSYRYWHKLKKHTFEEKYVPVSVYIKRKGLLTKCSCGALWVK